MTYHQKNSDKYRHNEAKASEAPKPIIDIEALKKDVEGIPVDEGTNAVHRETVIIPASEPIQMSNLAEGTGYTVLNRCIGSNGSQITVKMTVQRKVSS